MFNKSLTIVLPVHNAESRLRKNVGELLELASELTAKFGVLIIDDGSTDATFEVAEELAAHFPQVSVRRHRECRGLGAAIDYAQRRVRSDAVIVHDGVSPIDSQQVRSLWRRWVDQSISRAIAPAAFADRPQDVSDFANLSAIHATMERVHRRVIGFQLLTPLNDGPIADESPALSELPRTDTPHAPRRSGVGRVPPLPRPKFLAALAEFALGE
ncbi:MAG: glycosyltransferase [Planctomycetes bacterium]|nr:glycosyltransferase [Planctomycetota bacterium]